MQLFRAIESLAVSGAELLLFSVNAITTGTDAQGEVTVRLAKDGRIVNGQGADTDIIVASAKAYINALNKLSCLAIVARRRPSATASCFSASLAAVVPPGPLTWLAP
jgi:hypothetical protein